MNKTYYADRVLSDPTQTETRLSRRFGKALSAMNGLEAKVIAEQRAAAQPKSHRY